MLITAPGVMAPKEAYSAYRSGRHKVESAFGMVKGPIKSVNDIIKVADYREIRMANYRGRKSPLMAMMDFHQ
jgi:hypothetical protein